MLHTTTLCGIGAITELIFYAFVITLVELYIGRFDKTIQRPRKWINLVISTLISTILT